MPAGVKSINDWYAQRERGTAVGIFNSSTVLGQGSSSCRVNCRRLRYPTYQHRPTRIPAKPITTNIVRQINDWYAQRERGTAVGIFNSSTVLGQAIAPPALVVGELPPVTVSHIPAQADQDTG
jgi:sugar phosphate permease